MADDVFTITLLRAETRHESVSLAPLTVFVFRVVYRQDVWLTFRRFSQFASLESELRDFHPDEPMPRFPPKSATLWKSKIEEAVVQRRLESLQVFMNELLKQTVFRESAILLDWIQRDNEVRLPHVARFRFVAMRLAVVCARASERAQSMSRAVAPGDRTDRRAKVSPPN